MADELKTPRRMERIRTELRTLLTLDFNSNKTLEVPFEYIVGDATCQNLIVARIIAYCRHKNREFAWGKEYVLSLKVPPVIRLTRSSNDKHDFGIWEKDTDVRHICKSLYQVGLEFTYNDSSAWGKSWDIPYNLRSVRYLLRDLVHHKEWWKDHTFTELQIGQ